MFQTFVIIFAIFVQITKAEEGCTINAFTNWPPVILSTQPLEILYPPITNLQDDRNITTPIGTTILLSCKGGRYYSPYENTKTILATCNQNFQFEAQDKIIDFTNLTCVNFNPVTSKTTSSSCSSNSKLIEVGFEIGLNIEFLPQIRVCFDVEKLTPLYSQVNITKSIGFIKSYLTTQYIVDDVFNNINIDFDSLYDNLTIQQEKFNDLLGLEKNSTKYVDPKTCNPGPSWATTPGFCFSKRSLAYRGDFVYISQHYATYRYINIAPQWSFLDYNLDKLERNIIDFVKSRYIDLEVYTGTFQVATFPHSITGKETEVYFYSEQNRQAIPLPLYFWKLIYDGLSQNATVFITVNNPHLGDGELSNYVLCEDISDQIKWLTWENKNATKGYSYACTYEDAKNAISYLPAKEVKGILL